MNIKEAEKRTGITKQNIRFYEKKGLLSPERNEENGYREYTGEDIETLKKIGILRRIDVPIEQIRGILEGGDYSDILKKHLDVLTERESDLDAAIKMCRFLLRQKKDVLDADAALAKMEELERKGGKFMNILRDYKKVSAAETRRTFSFMPDTMALNVEEFTEALRKYGLENGLNLVVTKPGMYPKFEIDGREYEARREWGRFGAVILCEMTHPEQLEEEYADVEDGRRRALQRIYRAVTVLGLPSILFLYMAVVCENVFLAFVMLPAMLSACWFSYRNFRLDKKYKK